MAPSKKQQNTEKAKSLIGLIAFDTNSMEIVKAISMHISKKGNVTINAIADNGEKVQLNNKALSLHWLPIDQHDVAEQEKIDFYNLFFTKNRRRFDKAKRRIGSLAFDRRIPSIVEIVDADINGKGIIKIVVKDEKGKSWKTADTYMDGKWVSANQRDVVEKQKADYQAEILEQKKATFLSKKAELEETLPKILKYRDLVSDEGDTLIDANLEINEGHFKASLVLTVKARDGKNAEKDLDWFKAHSWMTEEDYVSAENYEVAHTKAIDELWQGMQDAQGIDINLLPEKYRSFFEKQCADADLDLIVSEYDPSAWDNHREFSLSKSSSIERLLKHRDIADPKQAVMENFDRSFSAGECGFDNYVNGTNYERLYLSVDDENYSWSVDLDYDFSFDFDRLSDFIVKNLDADSLLYLLKNTFDSKEELEEQFSEITNPKEALAAVVQGLGGNYEFRASSDLSEDLFMDTEWLAGQIDDIVYSLLKVEEKVAEKVIPQVFEEKYLPQLAKEYAELNSGFDKEKLEAKEQWQKQLAEYKQGNENAHEQKLFATLSAMSVLNHVAKTLQNYRSNSSDFEYDMLKDAYQSAESIYDLKNELLKAVYDNCPEYVKLSAFVPDDADKINVTFCDDHFDAFREERSYFGLTPMEYYFENKKEIDQCRKCDVTYNVNYYSMYSFEIKLPNAEFNFHEPYPVGRFDFPKLTTLPKVEQEVNEEGMFLFGREANFKESCLALAVDLTKPIKDFLQMEEL